jgi:hypothetical protein
MTEQLLARGDRVSESQKACANIASQVDLRSTVIMPSAKPIREAITTKDQPM